MKAEVVDEHIEKIQDLQNYKQQEDKISTSLFETTNKVGTLKTCEEILSFNDDEDIDIYIDENCGLLYKALIDQGVADALAARDVDRSMNGDDSHNSGTGVRRQAPLAHECTYPDFIKCKPLYFKGTKGVVELTHCLKNETVSRYKQLTDVGHDVAYAMTWTNLKKMMTDKYCPRGEIKKLEVEMWNLKVKGTYVHSCSRQARLRGKLDNINQAQQQPPKKQGVAIAYTAGSSKRKEYAGTLPLCNKCKFHHNGQCTVKCANSKRVGHLTRGLRIPALTNNQRNLTCNELESRHYKK
ncbi:hypothetical protein Tco_0364082 [Tanacetum coccineum]